MSWSHHTRSVWTRFYSTTLHNSPVVLRPYQALCLQACTEALSQGSTRIGVSLPTGSGKTTVFLKLLSRIQSQSHSKATRSLIIVSNVELAQQTAIQAARLFPEWKIEIEQGSRHVATGKADVTIATYQTLLQSTRLAKFDPADFKAVVVDEAHHAAAPAYRRILSKFHRSVKSDSEIDEARGDNSHTVPIVGFSATFSRHDGLALGSVYERIVYHRDFLDMIKEEWLCKVRFTTVRATLHLENVVVNNGSGDFNATSLSHVINTETVNQLVLQTWLDRAASRKSTVVFCVNLAHVRELTDTFRRAGVDARYVYSGTPAVARADLIADFKAGKFPVLLNCSVLTEGTDIPGIDCIIVARPTRSRNLFAQMIGRGMRLSPHTGKEDCHIIDLVDSVTRVSGIVSTPSLFGLDPSELIEDAPLEDMKQRLENEIGPPVAGDRVNIPEPEAVTYVDHDDISSLVADTSGAPHIRALSPHAWVGCGEDIYLLECMGRGYIRIEPFKEQGAEEEIPHDERPQYKASFVPATLPMVTAMMLKVSPFRRSEHVLTAVTLAEAVKGCDTFARSKVSGPLRLGLLRSAKWRQQEATANQTAWLQKRLGKSGRMDTSTLTKGQAGDLIVRIKHGALGRHQRKVKAKQKIIAVAAKEQARKAREHVRVGPLPGAVD